MPSAVGVAVDHAAGLRAADRRAPRPWCARAPPGTWRACRNASHSSAVRVSMISASTAISRVVIGVALVVGLLDHVGTAEQRPQPALLAQVAGAQHHQPVLGLERAVGGVRMAVAGGLRMHAVAQVAGDVRAHQDHRHVEHRHVDALAAPGALALEQRGRQREGAGHAGRVVDHRRADLDRDARPWCRSSP